MMYFYFSFLEAHLTSMLMRIHSKIPISSPIHVVHYYGTYTYRFNRTTCARPYGKPTIKHFGWSTHVSKAKFYGCGENAFLGQEIFVLSNHSAALQLCTAYKSSCSVRGCQFSSENLQQCSVQLRESPTVFSSAQKISNNFETTPRQGN